MDQPIRSDTAYTYGTSPIQIDTLLLTPVCLELKQANKTFVTLDNQVMVLTDHYIPFAQRPMCS